MDLQIQGLTPSTIQVADAAFGREFNEGLIHQVVTAYLAGGRAGTRAQKTRAQVQGGGRKPFRQKGTGRARAGTIRSPLWRTGGKVFAAVPQDHSQKVNRRMYRGAIAAVLSELVRQDRLLVVEQFEVDSCKTRDLLAKLSSMGVESGLIVSQDPSDNLWLAARNLRQISVMDVHGLDPVSLVGAERVVMTVAAVRHLEEALA